MHRHGIFTRGNQGRIGCCLANQTKRRSFLMPRKETEPEHAQIAGEMEDRKRNNSSHFISWQKHRSLWHRNHELVTERKENPRTWASSREPTEPSQSDLPRGEQNRGTGTKSRTRSKAKNTNRSGNRSAHADARTGLEPRRSNPSGSRQVGGSRSSR